MRNTRPSLLAVWAGIGAELGRHPGFDSVAKAAAHIVPEHRLLVGLISGLPRGRLSKEIDLV